MGVGILIGYFARQDEARSALRGLAQQGFSRTALVHRDTDGEVHIAGPFLWRSALRVALAACLFGGIAGMAALLLQWPNSLPVGNISSSLTLILASAVFGALAALLWLRRSRYGVEPGVMRDHALARIRGIRPYSPGPHRIVTASDGHAA